jgi:hypothetical protein
MLNTHNLTPGRLPACIGLVLALLLTMWFNNAAFGTPPIFTVVVKNASGAAVQGAAVCIGTSLDRAQYGTATTDQWGNATFSSLSLDTAFYVTANKDGYGAEHYVPNTSPVPIENLVLPLQLSAMPSNTACPGDGGSVLDFTLAIEIDPETLIAGQLFEIVIRLDQPPPMPVAVKLESSRPDLILLPAEITFKKGEQKKVLKAQVASRVSRASSVDVRGGIGKDPKKKAQKTVRVSPKAEK